MAKVRGVGESMRECTRSNLRLFLTKLTVPNFDSFALTILIFGTNKYLETFFFVFFKRGEGGKGWLELVVCI